MVRDAVRVHARVRGRARGGERRRLRAAHVARAARGPRGRAAHRDGVAGAGPHLRHAVGGAARRAADRRRARAAARALVRPGVRVVPQRGRAAGLAGRRGALHQVSAPRRQLRHAGRGVGGPGLLTRSRARHPAAGQRGPSAPPSLLLAPSSVSSLFFQCPVHPKQVFGALQHGGGVLHLAFKLCLQRACLARAFEHIAKTAFVRSPCLRPRRLRRSCLSASAPPRPAAR